MQHEPVEAETINTSRNIQNEVYINKDLDEHPSKFSCPLNQQVIPPKISTPSFIFKTNTHSHLFFFGQNDRVYYLITQKIGDVYMNQRFTLLIICTKIDSLHMHNRIPAEHQVFHPYMSDSYDPSSPIPNTLFDFLYESLCAS